MKLNQGILQIPLRTPTKLPATHTNAYLVGDRNLYLIDPSTPTPSEQETLWKLLDEATAEGRKLEGILLTHSHPDHIGAVQETLRRYELPLFAHRLAAESLPQFDFSDLLGHGQELSLGTSPEGEPDWRLKIYHLPGHAPGHLVFQETCYQGVIVGDLISTLSSILIDPQDGDLSTYVESLHFLESITEGCLYPGHGPPAKKGRLVVQRTLHHRQKREQRLLEALDHTPRTLDAILPKVYVKIDRSVVKYAERSLHSGLIKLIEEGRVEESADGYRLTADS
jgi:glyoxylase-like metal-dependent hydrolase (beta-lactamase superfamily II)